MGEEIRIPVRIHGRTRTIPNINQPQDVIDEFLDYLESHIELPDGEWVFLFDTEQKEVLDIRRGRYDRSIISIHRNDYGDS